MPQAPVPNAADRSFAWGLAAVTLIALAVRLYHLGTPSLWWDEILVPLTASQSAAQILARCRVMDFHPPAFYLLIKAVILTLGTSDFVLRLPSALAGAAAVPVLYALARPRLGPGPALLAAALLAVSGPLVLWSRQVRPYSLVVLFSLLAAKGLLDWHDTPTPGRMARAGAASFGYLVLHYLSVLLLGAQGLFLAAAILLEKRLRRPGQLAAYGLFAATGLACSFAFFHASTAEVSGGAMAATAATWLRHLAGAATGFSTPLAQVATAAAILLGLPALWRQHRPLAWLAASMILAPGAALVVARYDSYFSAWHLAFAVPFLYLAACAFLAVALPRLGTMAAVAGVAMALVGAATLLGPGHARYYEPESTTGTYKMIARTLPGLLRPGALVVYSASEEAEGVGWYLRRSGAKDPLLDRAVDLARPAVNADFVSFRDFGQMTGSEAGLAEAFGSAPRVDRATGVAVYHFTVQKAPPCLATLPGTLHLGLMAPAVAAQASQIQRIRLLPVFGGRASPQSGGVPATLAYDVALPAMAASPEPAFVRVTVAYDNPVPGNTLALAYAFDADTPRQAFVSLGPDPAGQKTVILRPGHPVSRLRLAFTLATVPFWPTMTGNTGPTLQLKGVDLHAGLPSDQTLGSASLALTFDGIGPIEHDASAAWRWAMGPTASCRFTLPAAEQVTARLAFGNPIPGQTVRVVFNGRELARFSALPAKPWLEGAGRLDLTLPGRAGQNALELRFADWNGKPHAARAAFAPGDGRPMAAPLLRLSLERAVPDACLVY